MASKKKIIFIAFLLIGLGASLFVAAKGSDRVGNRAVEIVVDYDEISDIAARASRQAEVLRAFKAAGARSVAITEMTFKDAVDEGLLVQADASAYYIPADLQGIDLSLNQLVPIGHGSAGRTFRQFQVSWLNGRPALFINSGLPMGFVERLPVGLPSKALSAARGRGPWNSCEASQLPWWKRPNPSAEPSRIRRLLA